MQIVIVSSADTNGCMIDALQRFGIKGQHCTNLTDVCELVDLYGFDMVLVNSTFGGGGQSAIKVLRLTHKKLPIVVFGTAVERDHILACFASGADDLFSWPGDAEIIAARIRAIVCRCKGADTNGMQIGPLRFDMIRRSLQVDGLPVTLTSKEYGVLEYMVTHKNMVSTKDALLNRLYGDSDAPDSRIIDVFVCKLRKKLAEYGVHDLIETARGLGYRLNDRACKFARNASEVGAIPLAAAQIA